MHAACQRLEQAGFRVVLGSVAALLERGTGLVLNRDRLSVHLWKEGYETAVGLVPPGEGRMFTMASWRSLLSGRPLKDCFGSFEDDIEDILRNLDELGRRCQPGDWPRTAAALEEIDDAEERRLSSDED